MKNGVSELPLFIRARGVWLSKVSFLLCLSDHPVRLDEREGVEALKYQCLCGLRGFGRGRKSKVGFSRKFTFFHVVRHKMAYKMAYRIKKMAYKLYCKERGLPCCYVNHITMGSALFFCSSKSFIMTSRRSGR